MVWHAGVALFVGERESKGGKEKKKKKKSDQSQLIRLELNDLHIVIKKVCYSQYTV